MGYLKKYYAVITGIIVLIVYITTLAPSVVEIDSGELASVQVLLGIAHPTGYPLFTLLGHLFSLIPVHFSKIYQLNLLTAIWCSAAVIIFTLTCKTILDNLTVFGLTSSPVKSIKSKKELNKRGQPDKVQSTIEVIGVIEEPLKYTASVLCGLMLGFNRTFWNQGNAVEVYSLQAFMFVLIIWSLLKAYIAPVADKGITKPWLIFAGILALGFTNHLTTLFVLPATAYIYFDKFRFRKYSIKRLIIMILAVFLPILIAIYLYLPLRALQNPPLNWGNPVDFERLLRHVSGWQFQVWFFKSTDVMKKQLDYYFSNLLPEFKICIVICLSGIIISFIKARKFFIFNIILLIFSLLYASNYDIVDIDSYFLLTYISLSFFGLFGIVWLLVELHFEKYKNSIAAMVIFVFLFIFFRFFVFVLVVWLLLNLLFKKQRHLIGTACILLFIITEMTFNYKDNDLKDVHCFEDYSTSVLNSVKPNSIIFSYSWDILVSPSCYFQLVEHYRPDVVVVDKELLRRSWYYNQVNTQHSDVLKYMKSDITVFLDAIKPFERNETFDANLLETTYRKIMTDLVGTNIGSREVYISPELVDNEMQKGEFVLPTGYTIVPDNLLFRVVKGKDYVPASDPDFSVRIPAQKNRYIDLIVNVAGGMLERRALYELQFNKIDRAKVYINKIRKDFPDYVLPAGLSDALTK